LTPLGAMTDNFRKAVDQEVVTLTAREGNASGDSLDQLRLEVKELRASCERLVRAAHADRRRIERELHDGPQQHLIALAVNLQLAGRLISVDPRAATALVEEMRRDVHEALDDLRTLAHRIYPPLLESGGLAAALRAEAASSGVTAHVQVGLGMECSAEIVATVYFCCVEALERMDDRATANITVRAEQEELVFEIVAEGSGLAELPDALANARARTEALGGRLTIMPDDGTRISGSLPMRS
jgi:signal transduction histidine kinase